MASTAVPSLSEIGWESDPETKADRLLAYYFTSQRSQSTMHRDGITSLQWQVQQWGNDPVALKTNMQSAMEAYLSKYFDKAIVQVTILDPTGPTDGRMNVKFAATVTQDGKVYSLGQLASTLNGKILQIVNINNGTTTLFTT